MLRHDEPGPIIGGAIRAVGEVGAGVGGCAIVGCVLNLLYTAVAVAVVVGVAAYVWKHVAM